ncbi:MAG TPA: CBS domain-containing protein [Streptosporangiaceae bacterium]|nr:CBS domain-containing protein [Streptosporangiaceae bacterium]
MAEASADTPSAQARQIPATVADVMRPALTTVDVSDHVAAAAYLMRHAGRTSLVVLDGQETNRPIGLITEADIVHTVADGKDVNEVRIRDLMTKSPKTIAATTSVRDAAETMLAGHFRHLPVVDGARLAGMVDIGDICRALLDQPSG